MNNLGLGLLTLTRRQLQTPSAPTFTSVEIGYTYPDPSMGRQWTITVDGEPPLTVGEPLTAGFGWSAGRTPERLKVIETLFQFGCAKRYSIASTLRWLRTGNTLVFTKNADGTPHRTVSTPPMSPEQALRREEYLQQEANLLA